MEHGIATLVVLSASGTRIGLKGTMMRHHASQAWSLRRQMWSVVAIPVLLCGLPGASSPRPLPDSGTLRQAAESRHTLIGAAAASKFLGEADYAVILGSEFSQLQAENEMKFGPIHPRPDTDPNPYDFKGGDALVAFAQSHNMMVRGHTLVWHNQVSKWLTEGKYAEIGRAHV